MLLTLVFNSGDSILCLGYLLLLLGAGRWCCVWYRFVVLLGGLVCVGSALFSWVCMFTDLYLAGYYAAGVCCLDFGFSWIECLDDIFLLLC